MQSPTLILLLGIFFTVSVAQARLLETETQCDTRYGTTGERQEPSIQLRLHPLVTGANTTNLVYLYEGWNITIGFINGIAHRMEYSKTGSNLAALKISTAETDAVLAANNGGQQWTRVRKADIANPGKLILQLLRRSNDNIWIRNDRSVAYLSPGFLKLRLESNFAIQRDVRANEAKQRADQKSIPRF